MKKLFVLMVFLCSMLNLFAQKESNNWCFADSVLLTFQGNTIKIDDSVISIYEFGREFWSEATASISASTGELQFYIRPL